VYETFNSGIGWDKKLSLTINDLESYQPDIAALQVDVGTRIKIDGSTLITGNLSMDVAAPVNNSHLTRKDYVDSKAAEYTFPPGAVVALAGWAIPSGWLAADGSSVSRTTYAALFAAIGTIYGSANAGVFSLPDLRGEFIRGYDNDRGADPDSPRNLGSNQQEAFKSHDHSVDSTGHTSSSQSLTELGQSNIGGFRTNFSGGDETRPRNVSMRYCIKT